MNIKSPFFVIEEFISPLSCENMIDDYELTVPNCDINGNFTKTIIHNESIEQYVYENIQIIVPTLEKYYDFVYKGINSIQLEWFPVGSNQNVHAENSVIQNNKWVRNNINDFTGILFLSDFQNQSPLDGEFEVYGGKTEFIFHKFSINPHRGTLIIFPSDPHFANGTSNVLLGNLYQIRFQITSNPHWTYNMSDFPGNYTNWF